MSAHKQTHRYSYRPSKRRAVETAVKWFFRLATYIVIIAAGYIFANIAYNGSKAVFTTQAPFINIDFLTQKPQTLHVYEPKEIDTELKQINAQRIQLQAERNNLGSGEKEAAAALTARLKTLEERHKVLDAQRKDGRLLFSDSEYRQLAEKPEESAYAYSNYAYSGGGIGPAIIGTCLLVIGSITIALTLGVLCAV